MDTLKTKSNYYDQFDGYALMYADTNCQGTMQDAVNMYNRIPQKITIDHVLFQKISSIEVHCNYISVPGVKAVLECFDQTSWQGNSLIVSGMWHQRLEDLSKVPCKNGTWNDRICSVIFNVKVYNPFQ